MTYEAIDQSVSDLLQAAKSNNHITGHWSEGGWGGQRRRYYICATADEVKALLQPTALAPERVAALVGEWAETADMFKRRAPKHGKMLAAVLTAQADRLETCAAALCQALAARPAAGRGEG